MLMWQMFRKRNVVASSASQQYVLVSTGGHYFRSYVENNNCFDVNTQNFVTYTGTHGQ